MPYQARGPAGAHISRACIAAISFIIVRTVPISKSPKNNKPKRFISFTVPQGCTPRLFRAFLLQRCHPYLTKLNIQYPRYLLDYSFSNLPDLIPYYEPIRTTRSAELDVIPEFPHQSPSADRDLSTPQKCIAQLHRIPLKITPTRRASLPEQCVGEPSRSASRRRSRL